MRLEWIGLSRGSAGVDERLDRHGIAEVLKVLEGPNDLLLRSNFNDLGILWPRMAVSYQGVSVGETLNSCDPRKGDAWKIILLHLPDNLLLRGRIEHAMPIAGADQGVAILESYG